MGLGGTRRAPRVHVVVFSALLGALWTAHAPMTLAQAPPRKEASAADVEKARELAKKSADAYRRGDFNEALTLLTEAYALERQPVLLYNKARAHEGLGNTD